MKKKLKKKKDGTVDQRTIMTDEHRDNIVHGCTKHYITFKGLTLSRVEWCKKLGLEYATLRYRLTHGWSIEDVLDTAKYHVGKRYRKLSKKHRANISKGLQKFRKGQ